MCLGESRFSWDTLYTSWEPLLYAKKGFSYYVSIHNSNSNRPLHYLELSHFHPLETQLWRHQRYPILRYQPLQYPEYYSFMTLPDFYTKNVLMLKNIFRDETIFIVFWFLCATISRKMKIVETCLNFWYGRNELSKLATLTKFVKIRQNNCYKATVLRSRNNCLRGQKFSDIAEKMLCFKQTFQWYFFI